MSSEIRIGVIGAGMVGVSCAWALQQRGVQVSLFDRRPPGSETSHGNAGVLSPTSLLPFNHPGLWRQLPGLLLGRSPGFQTRPGHVLSNRRALSAFLAQARPGVLQVSAKALHGLITASRRLHHDWLQQAGLVGALRETGWLFLYRSEAGWQAADWARGLYRQHGLRCEALDPAALSRLEPSLPTGFVRALWVQDAASVNDPGGVVKALARTVVDRGGRFVQDEVQGLQRLPEGRWQLQTAMGRSHVFDHVVVALGPWSRDFLQACWGWQLPMLHERGYHMHYGWQGSALQRPVYDTAAGCVVSPMDAGVRLTTGVELDDLHAPARDDVLDRAERAARQLLPLGPRLDAQPWRGSRPTLPDSRPMVGAAPGMPGIWLALGHQHIGFSTGPGSGELLANLMFEEPALVDPEPFSPLRFGSRWCR